MESEHTARTSTDGKSGDGPRYCDVVMKGGVTSGVVYPLAVVELAQIYRFRNIGGTSAGAIAAAATAAAELGRSRTERSAARPAVAGGGNGPGGKAGFEGLRALPAELSQPDRVFSLFQPVPKTTGLFAVAIAALGSSTGRAWRVISAALRQFWRTALLGALPGMIAVAAAIQVGGLALLWVLLPALLLLVVGVAVAVALRMARCALSSLPATGFGLCPGMGDERALTPWLTRLLDDLAGIPAGKGPLTFGDLWGDDPQSPAINLEMMTTCLTQGRPFTLPYDLDDEPLYFNKDDFNALFPTRVVDWLVKHAGTDAASRLPVTALDDRPVYRLPPARDLPVVVATRLSLSFPILLSAVPLYAVDGSLACAGDALPKPERCWFSDGGLTSNMPVHFFDRMLPRWPTFGINLRDLKAASMPDPAAGAKEVDQSAYVHLPTTNQDGSLAWWSRFDGLLGFLHALPTTMMNWADSEQMRLPGYRDRVVHIGLGPGEGGLNLRMDQRVCERLSERGRLAGAELRARFAEQPDQPMGWNNHRWVRYRSSMAAAQQLLAGLPEGYNDPMNGDRSYAELIVCTDRDPQTQYGFASAEQRARATQATQSLVDVAAAWGSGPEPFIDGAPAPGPQLRIGPKVPNASPPARPLGGRPHRAS